MKEQKGYRASLSVNGAELELNRFINDFVAQVTEGMLLSLKGVESVESAQIQLEHGKVKVTVNGRHVPTDSYANDMIAATAAGMVSILKGGSNCENLLITIETPAL